MKRLVLLSVAAASLVGVAGFARADVTIQWKQGDEVQQAYLKPHMFSVTRADGEAIFRGDKKVFWNVNAAEKTCQEMTEADAKAMGEQISAASAQMQQAMKNMPPEQRAMMEKRMAGRVPKSTPPADERVVTPTGQSRTINGFPCSGYLIKEGDGRTTEVWATDLKDAHLNPSDLAVFTEFSEFMKSMLGTMGLGNMRDMVKDWSHPGPKDVPGLPVLSIEKDASGKELSRSELLKVDHASIPADKFEVPAGYKMKSMAEEMSGGKRGGK